MCSFRGSIFFLLIATPVYAQTGLPAPRLQSAAPASLRPGGVAEITLVGQDLDEPHELLFSHPGIKATRIAPVSVAKKTPNQTPLSFKIEAPANTPGGWLDMRVSNKWGVSNPVALRVGSVPELAEREPNNQLEQAQRIELNAALHGVIAAPTDVDYFVFTGTKGQGIVVSCLASSIGSPLQAAVAIYSRTGQELGVNHHYQGNDALVSCRLPADDEYLVRVHSFGYTAGTANHAYRLAVSTAPWIDAIFPPVVEAGRATKLTVFGRNLPGGKPAGTTIGGCAVEKAELLFTPPVQVGLVQGPIALNPVVFMPPDLEWLEYSLAGSNAYVLGVAKAPVVIDNGDNDTPDKAQPITLPGEITGSIEKRRDRDWYVFSAKKGETWDIDVLGDRIGSLCDLFFVLRDAQTGKTITEQDDKPPSQDPGRYRFTAPADGRYLLLIGSRNADVEAGPRHFYRVSLRREEPGFTLLLVNQPELGVLRRGSTSVLPIAVTRFGDWNGAIQLAAENLPPGVACPPQTIEPGMKQGMLVCSAAADAGLWTGAIKITGTAVIAGKRVRQPVRALITPSVYARSIVLAVRESAPFTLAAKANKGSVLQGDKLTVSIAATNLWPDLKLPVQVTALNLPAGMSLTGKNPSLPFGGQGELAVVCKPDMQPGTYTLLLQGQTQVSFAKFAKQPTNIAIKLPSTPVTVTVLPTKVATVSVTPTTPIVKIGKSLELMVKVKRLYDYDGPFKVRLVIPETVKGLSAEEVLIPAGKDETKFAIKADANAAAGVRPGLQLRVTAPLPQGELIHDYKLTAIVGK